MNKEALKNLRERCSIRRYEERAIPQALLDEVLDGALHSPTARNSQHRQFTVVRNQEKIAALADAIGKELDRDDYGFYGAPCLILVSVPRDYELGQVDTGTAMQNIYLAAEAVGLGACWINQLRGICDEARVREVLRDLKIPDDHIVWAFATIGYPAEEPTPKERKEAVVYVD